MELARPTGDPIPDLSDRRILVAEDDPVHRSLLFEVLEPTGAVIDAATNGADALNQCLRRPPDLLVLDIGLPLVDGVAVARMLRANGMPIRILAVTGYATQEDREAGHAAGIDRYLTKPYTIDALYAELASMG